jgi:hypothetical protein
LNRPFLIAGVSPFQGAAVVLSLENHDSAKALPQTPVDDQHEYARLLLII